MSSEKTGYKITETIEKTNKQKMDVERGKMKCYSFDNNTPIVYVCSVTGERAVF